MKKAFLIQTALLAVAALIHFSAGTATFGADGLFSGNGIGVLWSIRLPRLLTACAAGAAMGIAGVLLQAFFRNPMADPFVLGIHSGAAFGVALVTLIFRGLTGAAVAAVLLSLGSTAAAFAGAAAVTVFMAVLSVRMRSRTALLVAGLMLGYGLNAVISLFIFFSSPREWEWFLSWNFASFSGTRLAEAALLTAVTAAAPLRNCGGIIRAGGFCDRLLRADGFCRHCGAPAGGNLLPKRRLPLPGAGGGSFGSTADDCGRSGSQAARFVDDGTAVESRAVVFRAAVCVCGSVGRTQGVVG